MIPDEIWTGKECAAYLKLEAGYFMANTRHKKTFPKPLPFNEGGRPRWSSAEVRSWALGPVIQNTPTPHLRHSPVPA